MSFYEINCDVCSKMHICISMTLPSFRLKALYKIHCFCREGTKIFCYNYTLYLSSFFSAPSFFYT